MDAFQPLINLMVLLTALSLASERVTNVIKLRHDKLRNRKESEAGEKERERDVTQVNLAVAVLTALVLKADFFQILANLESPWDTLGWAQMQAGSLVRSSALSGPAPALYAAVGALITGFAMGFGSKFWHDLLDIVFNARERLRVAKG